VDFSVSLFLQIPFNPKISHHKNQQYLDSGSILLPASSTVRPKNKAQKEAGSSSTHHFFRGELLNFGGVGE